VTVKIEWYSGTGKGGQHRNKHQNCCRITHIETGLMATGARSRSRLDNERDARAVLTARVAAYYHQDKERGLAGTERIRTFHEPDNRATDHLSGVTIPYRQAMDDIGPLIDARRLAIGERDA
jgi:protein subunit release factor A